MTRLFAKYRRIARSISPLEIASNYMQVDLGWDDIGLDFKERRPSDLFLGKYSESGIRLILKRFGLERQARRMGIKELTIDLNMDDPFRHILRIYDGQRIKKDRILVEFIARYQQVSPKSEELDFLYPKPLKVLMVEWLLLQNPEKEFSPGRPRLPGQEHPGLGLGEEMLALFGIMGRHLKVDGIMNVPRFLHTAMFFGRRSFFLSADIQVQHNQLVHDLWEKYKLAEIAWGSFTGSIIDRLSGEPFSYEPRKMLFPIRRSLVHYFRSDLYQDTAEKVDPEGRYWIDLPKLKSELRAVKNPPAMFEGTD